jgi:hypothetical protein
LLAGVGFGGRRRSAHPPPGSARQLTCRVRGAAGDLADVAERNAEHVVEDEGEALGGGEVLEHDEHREPDRVGELGLLGRVPLGGLADDRLEVVVR